MLDILHSAWPQSFFQASNVAELINRPMKGEEENAVTLRAFFDSGGRRNGGDVTSIMIGKRLGTLVDAPVVVDGRTLKLIRDQPDNQTSRRATTSFKVRVVG